MIPLWSCRSPLLLVCGSWQSPLKSLGQGVGLGLAPLVYRKCCSPGHLVTVASWGTEAGMATANAPKCLSCQSSMNLPLLPRTPTWNQGPLGDGRWDTCMHVSLSTALFLLVGGSLGFCPQASVSPAVRLEPGWGVKG